MRAALSRTGFILAAVLAASSVAQPAAAQQTRRVSLAALTAQGFEVKAVTGNQVGVVGTLVLQKEKDIYLCNSKDLSIDPTAFECWPVK
jgi:hypothetical protein